MKIALLVILKLFVATDSGYLDQILSDYGRHSYYVTLQVSSPSYTGPVVVENSHLYLLFKRRHCIEKKTYQDSLKTLIEENEIISVSDEELKKLKFKKVSQNCEVEEVARRGLSVLTKKYFNDRGALIVTDPNAEIAIIYHLFKWQIPIKRDDESGYLFIHSAK